MLCFYLSLHGRFWMQNFVLAKNSSFGTQRRRRRKWSASKYYILPSKLLKLGRGTKARRMDGFSLDHVLCAPPYQLRHNNLASGRATMLSVSCLRSYDSRSRTLNFLARMLKLRSMGIREKRSRKGWYGCYWYSYGHHHFEWLDEGMNISRPNQKSCRIQPVFISYRGIDGSCREVRPFNYYHW